MSIVWSPNSRSPRVEIEALEMGQKPDPARMSDIAEEVVTVDAVARIMDLDAVSSDARTILPRERATG
jgi:hypothetical protein